MEKTETVQKQENASPAVKEEKTFTQDEVNKIVSERLARDRAKAEQEHAEKNADLVAREQEVQNCEERVECEKFLADMKLPETFLDLFDTDDSENFKYQVTTATNAFMGALNQAGIIAGKYWPNVRKGVRADDSDLLDVFAGKVKHKPRFFE